MTAYVRRQTTKYGYHRFHVYEGLPENHNEDTKTVGIYVTRRQAIRKAEQDGYKVIIKLLCNE
ncbi:MAG: hypothetical protein FWC20_00910 [Oscillospiraceae bacterium]|nr:hypothetical protein [Oscillospiraceae bacterium]MCL2277954.1 hypothetical protein [Oscillospiraceae bacterium]